MDDIVHGAYRRTQPGTSSSASAEPPTRLIDLDGSMLLPATVQATPTFNITRLRSCDGIENSVTKLPAVPALLVSVPLLPVACSRYRLWAEDKVLKTSAVLPFRVNVIDFAFHPGCWTQGVFDYVHYHVPRGLIDDVAEDLGCLGIEHFRQTVLEEDIVLAQLTRSVLPFIGRSNETAVLALDQLSLVLCAHLVQRYGVSRSTGRAVRGMLAPWQARRATDLLLAHLEGRLPISSLARECSLSVSQFARSFKATFGVTPHQWLVRERITRAKQLLADSAVTLGEVALKAGFSDQAAFSRTFHRLVGATPGQWRRARTRSVAGLGEA
jgi:AraC family transcriptional regulator